MQTFIKLKLFATLQRFTPENPERFPVETGCTIKVLLERLNIPPSESKLIFINGVRAEPESSLKGGERIGIFPPVGGG